MRPAHAAVFALGLACSEPPAAPTQTALTEGAVARVDGEPVRGETVARIASAEGVSLEEARRHAISDLLFAAEARKRGIDGPTRGEQAAALARTTLARLRKEADDAGPVTDEELADLVERRWYEIDRPAGLWILRAQVVVASTAAAGSLQRAEKVAARIHDAILPLVPDIVAESSREPGGLDPAALAKSALAARVVAAVTSVDPDGFEVTPTVVPAFAPDGRTVEPAPRRKIDDALVTASRSLGEVGSVSPPKIGDGAIDVFVVLGRTRAAQLDREGQRAAVREEAVARRTRVRLTTLLAELSTRTPVDVDRQVDGLLGLVRIADEP